MIKINLIAVGKVKEKYFSEGISEYKKRLSRFCDFSIIEVQEENFNKVDSSVIETILDREAQRILPYLKGKVYLMAIEGEKLSSEKFANLIKKDCDEGNELTFVIGGSYGISNLIKEKAKLISFSNMTFPHTLFRLMFTEQLYRAFSINAGSNYHK